MIRSISDYLPSSPANVDSSLLRGCSSWWMVYPVSRFGGSRLRDLMPRSSFGGGNNGTLVGSPSWQGNTNRPGGTGTLVYNGTSSQVRFTSILIPNGLTYTAWFYARVTADRTIIANRSTAVMWNNGNYNWWYNTASANASVASGAVIGKWYHMTVTSTLAGAWSMYTNGVSVGSGTNAINTADESRSNRLGYYDYGGRWWNGFLDDVRVYTRPLTADEVFRVYEDSLRGYPETLLRVRGSRYSFGVTPQDVASAFNAAWALNSNKILGGGIC